MDIPIEHVIRRGMYEVAQYFRDLIEKERFNNRVPVLVKERPLKTIFFVPCDVFGLPKIRYYEFLTFNYPKKMMIQDQDVLSVDNMSVVKKTIRIQSPLIMSNYGYDYPPQTFYFMWEGEIMETIKLDKSDLNVSTLLSLAQEAIKKREPLLLDEVSKNKLIK